MTFAIHNPDGQMYLINDPVRNGLLTWDQEGKFGQTDRYIMAFTESDKAEEYNAIVLQYRSGEVVLIKQKDASDFARKMVEKGVFWMIIDYPVINDQDFWDNPKFTLCEIPRELGRDYCIVDLRGVVARV